jgi:hypothetical protein
MFRRLKAKWHWLSDSAFADRKASHDSRIRDLAVILGQRHCPSAVDWEESLESLNDLRVPSLMRGPTPRKWKLFRYLLGPIRTPILALLGILIAFSGVFLILAPLVERAIPQFLFHLSAPLQGSFDPWWPLLLETIRILFLLELICLFWWLLYLRKSRSQRKESSTLRERARLIHGLFDVKYVVMGHTHEADLHDSGPDQHYFNTGTWTKVFGEEERVLKEEKEFTFVRVTGTGQNRRARLMKWEGGAKTARLAYLFSRL